MRTSYIKSKPIYEDRARLIEQIPGFWSKVLQSDDVPPAIESCIYACDIPALDLLTAIEVTRFEVDGDPERGDPRSFRIKFEFDHNGFLADRVLEKTFWYRSDQDGRAGLVSGPVEIRFSQMPQGNPLAQGSAKMESFFAFLRYGGRKDTADEPPKYAEDLLEAKDGSSDSSMPKVEQGSDSDLESLLKRTVSPDDDDDDSLAHEIFPLGEDIAIAISEDLYPGALKYFGVYFTALFFTFLRIR